MCYPLLHLPNVKHRVNLKLAADQKSKMKLSGLEKLTFPLFLFIFEVIFLIIYGLIVCYDEGGAPHSDIATAIQNSLSAGNSPEEFVRNLQSSLSTTKTYPFFQDVHVMIFIGFGFLMTFLRRYGFGSVAFNMLVAAFAIQWYTITSGVFGFIGQAFENGRCRIFVSIEGLVTADFGAAAALITMGAVLGRASPFQLIIITFFELIFYSSNEALNIYVFQAADIGGSMLIHTFGAYFGLGVSVMLYRKKANNHPKNSTVYHSDLFAMIGTIFLWMFWPSFNGALASGNAQYRAVINTYYSMTASVISTFIFSMLTNKERKLDMSHIQNATLAGGVAVGSVADMVLQPWGALLIGFLAGLISVIGYRFISSCFEKFYIQDTCGVHNLHGLPGVFSGIASAVAAGLAEMTGDNGKVAYGDSLFVVFPARAPTSNVTHLDALEISPGDGRHAGTQAGFQLALLVTTLAISIVGGLITGAIVHFLPAFSNVSDEDLYDDMEYWELPDDADNYLPKSDDEDGRPQVISAHLPPEVAQYAEADVRQRGSHRPLSYTASAGEDQKQSTV